MQNADDAGATELCVILDLRTHRGHRLPDQRMIPLCGPALLLRNNARFTPDDVEAIRRISESSKLNSGPKTGRFGLGFNTAYNITDHPAFVTNETIYCFDPHQNAVAQGSDYGRAWMLEKAWPEFPDWPRLFSSGGLPDGCRDFNGTIFRLPFRPKGWESDICNTPFGAAEARAIFAEAVEAGSNLLLFTRNLEALVIEEVDDQSRREVLRVELQASEAFRHARAVLNEALKGDLPTLLAAWRADGLPLPSTLCSSRWRVTTPDSTREELWRMFIGLARGVDDRLLNAAQEMMKQDEKAVPWVGVAAQLDGDRVRPVAGRLYCGLPLPVANGQPIHINGYFDLDSSRQHLTSVASSANPAIEARVAWNAALLEEGGSMGWAALLTELAPKVEGLYSLFPVLPQSDEAVARMVGRTYDELAEQPVIRVVVDGGAQLVAPKQLQLPEPRARVELFEPLVAEGVPMPSPALPATVEENFRGAITALSPAKLREMLRLPNSDIDWAIAEAPRPCLRQREWIEQLLIYASSDGSKELSGLPLLIRCDGRLHTIGKVVCLATDEVRALFTGQPHWFVEPSFATRTQLSPIPEVQLRQMDLRLVLGALPVVLGKDPVRDWSPESQTPPNRDWLRRLLAYLVRQQLDPVCHSALSKLPLFPGSDGRLYASLHEPSPLIVEENASQTLLAALRKLGIIVLDQDGSLRELLRKASLLSNLDGPRLVEALYERRDDVETLRQEAGPLLDYLAEPRWTYTPAQQQQLSAVPLFLSDHGSVALVGSNVFLPSQFQPPDLALDIHLLTEDRRWGRLYEKLGVTEIDASVYLKKALLPSLPSLAPEERRRALGWLRSMWAQIADRLQNGDAAKIRKQLGAIPLVWGMDAALHPISELHDPDSQLVRDVIGSEAKYPDMDRYADKRDAWLAFFRQFGLIRDLRKSQLVQHVKTMVGRGLAAKAALERVFRYLDEMLAETAAVEVLTELRDLAWLPAKQTSKAHGFVAPNDRLYKPTELALWDRLVGSQLPVAAWRPTRKATTNALRIRRPAAGAVILHFRVLIEQFRGQTLTRETARDFGRNFEEIYRYLGQFRLPPHTQPSFSTEDMTLIKEIARAPCIWDSATERLWYPAHVFAVPVPFFAPLRTCVRGDAFLTVLGRNEEPTSVHFAGFLKDLQSRTAGSGLDETQRKQAVHALNQLALGHDGGEALPLLTTDDRLVNSTDLYWDDAPWLRGRLTEAMTMASSDIPSSLLDALRVRRLSEVVVERVAHIERQGVTEPAAIACGNLARRVASHEFAAGLERLVRHEHGSDAQFEVIRLAIEPVVRVEVELHVEGARSLGRTDAAQYFDDARPCLYLVGSSEARMVKWVAQAVSRLLGANALQSTAASLEHILACEPAEIDAVLNEDRIPRIVSEVSEVEWEEPTDDASQADVDNQDDQYGQDETSHDETSHDETRQDEGTGRTPSVHAGTRRVQAHAILPVELTTFTAGETSWHRSDTPGRGNTPTLRVASDKLWEGASESRPPIDPGDGLSRTRREGVGGERPRLEIESGEADEATRKIEEQAIEFAMRYELDQDRSPRRLAERNAGHDLQSTNASGEIRYIEVKGIARDWRDNPVRLTVTQLAQAQARGDHYWLYVVERLSGAARLHRINDLARHIVGFTIDSKWARFADEAPLNPIPKEGLLLLADDEVLGKISRIKKAGALFRVWYHASNGMEIALTYQPGKHTLKDPEDGTNNP